ncbi:hypothetical protein RB595_002067 [Gaeumannomyces hyphopodioides]
MKLLLMASPAAALVGYGIRLYTPVCAAACREAIAPAPLACSRATTTPQCRAFDAAFLTTLAWCMRSTCAAEPWVLEKYWAEKTTGDGTVPMWTYQQTLARIEAPTRTLPAHGVLGFTALVDMDVWAATRDTLVAFERAETLNSRYGIILLVAATAVPVLLTIANRLPFCTALIARLRPLVYLALAGRYHVRPLPYHAGNAPTTGQALYVGALAVLTATLTALGYATTPGSTFYASPWQETVASVGGRTGVLALALAPLVILLSGRNSFLLWATDWPHSTFVLLHRWAARLFGLQVVLHSALELVLYADMAMLDAQTEAFWVWGCIATAATCLMLVLSVLAVRRLSYEVFLGLHVVLAVAVLVGSWYHVELRFRRQYGYEMWLYAACAVWASERLLRLLRVAKNGVRTAEVTPVAADVVRVDIPGITWAGPGMHVYVYFPTLHLRPWENHPFSVVPTSLLRGWQDGKSGSSRAPPGDMSGITLYVRRSGGATRHLAAGSLTTLLDGPYRNHAALPECDRLVLVAGGIGITGVLALSHPNAKLYWALREDAVGLARDLQGALAGVDKEVRVGRLDVAAILEHEAGWKRVGVVVCGPAGLCDDVRALVAKRGWELQVEAYSW